MKLIFAFLFLFVFSSCNLKVTEMAKTYVKTSSGSRQCLKDFSINMEAYFLNQLSSNDFKEFWLCFSNSIAMFASVVKGEEKEQFQVDEIFLYISKFLDEPASVTQELVTEVSLIKKWLLGGSNTVTKAELKQLSQALISMTPSLLKLLDHMEFYNLFTEDDSVDKVLAKYSWQTIETKLQQASLALSEVVIVFNKFTPHTNYSSLHLKQFFLQMDLFFNNGQRSKISDFVEKQEQLFQAVQVLILPKSKQVNNEFSPYQWGTLLSVLGKAYPLFMEYKLTMQGQSLFELDKLDYFVLWFNRTFNFIEGVVESQINKTISYSRLVPIFEYFYNNSVLAFQVDERLLSVLIGRFFVSAKNKLKKSNNLGLSIESLAAIKVMVEKWTRAQVILSGSVSQKVKSHLFKTQSDKDFLYYNNLLSVTENSVYFFQKEGVISLVENQFSEKMDYYNLFTYNTLLSLVERVFYAYSAGAPKVLSADDFESLELSPSEIKNLLQDVFYLLESFGINVPVKVDSAAELSRVLAQFFSYSSRGSVVTDKIEYVDCIIDCNDVSTEKEELISRRVVSESVSFSELLDFFSITHASLQRASKDFLVIKEDCQVNCVDFFFSKILRDDNLSILSQYFLNGSEKSREEFFSLLSKNVFNQEQEVTKAKLFLSYTIFYFIESVMLKYDKDGSGILDEEELTQAFAVFEGLVIKLLESDNSDTGVASVKQAFHFSLTMPVDAGIWEKIKFLFNPPLLQADPLSLARVLSTIIASEQ